MLNKNSFVAFFFKLDADVTIGKKKMGELFYYIIVYCVVKCIYTFSTYLCSFISLIIIIIIIISIPLPPPTNNHNLYSSTHHYICEWMERIFDWKMFIAFFFVFFFFRFLLFVFACLVALNCNNFKSNWVNHFVAIILILPSLYFSSIAEKKFIN